MDDAGVDLTGLSLPELLFLAALLPGVVAAKDAAPEAEVSVMIEGDGLSVIVGLERGP